MSTNLSVITSQDGKLNTKMNIDLVKEGSYVSERARNKAVSLFEKADKNQDGQLDADEIKAYNTKQTWKKVAISVGTITVATILSMLYLKKPWKNKSAVMENLNNASRNTSHRFYVINDDFSNPPELLGVKATGTVWSKGDGRWWHFPADQFSPDMRKFLAAHGYDIDFGSCLH